MNLLLFTIRTLPFLLCVAHLALNLNASAKPLKKSTYRIDGLSAPQVQANPIAKQLLVQLLSLRLDLEARSKKVTLQQAIEAALLNNPNLAVDYAQIQNREWNLIAIRRQWYPTMSADSSNIPSQKFRTTKSSGVDVIRTKGKRNLTEASATTSRGMSVNLEWTFFNPSLSPTINSASESLRQQQLLFDVSVRNLVLSVQQNYFVLQEYQELINAYDEIQLITDQQVKLTEAQFNSGLLSLADVNQIRTQQYRSLSNLINTYRNLLDAAAQLARDMAMQPGILVLNSDPLSVTGSWSQPLPETIAQALQLREEIKASLAGANAASWTARSLFNSYLPKFTLAANGRTNFEETSLKLNTNTVENLDGGISLGFKWQFFDGGIAAANAKVNQATANQFLQTAATNRLTVINEVEKAYGTYITSKLAFLSSKAQVLAARQAVIAVKNRYKVGVTDMATVVQTLIQANDAANAYATATRTYNVSVASLYRYSALWPEGTEETLQQRTTNLRQQ